MAPFDFYELVDAYRNAVQLERIESKRGRTNPISTNRPVNSRAANKGTTTRAVCKPSSQPTTTYQKGKGKVKCFKCSGLGHKASECLNRGVHLSHEDSGASEGEPIDDLDSFSEGESNYSDSRENLMIQHKGTLSPIKFLGSKRAAR